MKEVTLHLFIIIFLISVQSKSVLSAAQGDSVGLPNTYLEDIIKFRHLQVELEGGGDSEQLINVYKGLGKSYQLMDQFDSSLFFYKKGTAMAKRVSRDSIYSSLIYNIGLIYLHKGHYKHALKYVNEALEIDKVNNDYESLAASLNAAALIYQKTGIYDKALEFQLESIKLSEQNNRKEDIANGYYNLGNIYKKFDKNTRALRYYEQARELYFERIKNDSLLTHLHYGLSETFYSSGEVFISLQKYDSALFYLHEALNVKLRIYDRLGLANIYNQFANIFVLQGNFQQALQNYFQALQYKLLLGDIKGIAVVYSNIGNVYYRQNEISKSEVFLKKSNESAEKIQDKEVLSGNFLLLAEICKSRGTYERAFGYLEKYTLLKDSLFKEKNRKVVEEMSVRYETDKKEQENQILQQNNKIQGLTIQRQKSVRNYLIGATVLVLIIVVFIYIQYLSKKRTNKIISNKNVLLKDKNQQIERQKRLIELKNIDLTDSIHYAKRIQESLLAKSGGFERKVKDAFILFKPKDIVSGDFYWTGEQNGKFIISSVDCTGHGVPGAFMSMLGDSYLNHIVYNHKITSPERILDALDKDIRRALKQEDTNNQDGMDMALCSVELANNTVEFAGAKNPLIYIQNNELVKISGSRQPVGGSIIKNGGFEKHTIEVKSPTCFYMFSDGYQSQFGGAKKKKFMAKNLQKLIFDIHQKPMKEQKKILEETILEWMQGTEQIDDILVIGFRL